MPKKRKKSVPIWVVCLEGLAAALAMYVIGLMILTALVLRGAMPENFVFASIAILCAASSLLGGVISSRRTHLGVLPGAMLSAGTFAAILVLGGTCWCGVDWTGEGGGLLACALCGGLLAGLIKRRKTRHTRKLP